MEAREELTRLMVWLVQQVDEIDSKQLKADIVLLLGAASQLTTVLADRNTSLAKQHRSRKAKPPKPSPASGPKKGNGAESSTDKADAETGTEDRSKELSAIQQGIRQADPTIADQRRALRQQIYGQQNDDVAFAKAAQAIAR